MDDIIDFVTELLGELLETALESIQKPQIRKWALTVFIPCFGSVLQGSAHILQLTLQERTTRRAQWL